MKFLVGRKNLACTIFVPFDCDNNCPFCTSKKMYKNIDLNPEAIMDKIKLINGNYDITEFVLTGGEPFADLETTKKLVGLMEKKCFINTTFPLVENIEEVIDFINNEPKIHGINISRHIGHEFSGVANIDLIGKIKKPIRINTVINKNFNFSDFANFVKKWGSDTRMINLRADYTKLDTTSLKARDEVETWLAENYLYMGSGGCLVCHSSTFEADNCMISYHRGLMYSSVKMGERTYINDAIITPDGKIYKDWDFKEDVEFNNWIFKIPDMKETYISAIVDWEGKKEYQEYFYSSIDKGNINITRFKSKAKTVSHKDEMVEIIDTLKKQLRKSLVEIKTE
jgi:organic radical activating enzyme